MTTEKSLWVLFLIVEVDLSGDLDGEDLVPVRAVDVDQPAGLGRRADLEGGQDGEVGGKLVRKDQAADSGVKLYTPRRRRRDKVS